jgi:3-hydroxyacyl-CoA dehydrogenase/enoyl-CoA hydratase/3-hydroxybutyryl-CoA epimerase
MPDASILRLDKRERGVYVLWMDDTGESQNTLKTELVDEFERLLAAIENDAGAKALVFISGKPDSFLAGANLQMLRGVETPDQGAELSRLAQGMHDRISRLRCASVAAIHGPCLGGGLELALAFDARISSDSSRTRLGLPEVQLGLLPAGGGTQRLLRQIDVPRALDMLLTGRALDARQALRSGLVDEIVPQSVLLEAAINLALERLHGKPARRRSTWRDWGKWRDLFLTRTPPGRKLLLSRARAQVQNKTRGLYPAPQRILAVVETGLRDGFEQGLLAEAQAFGDLLLTPESRQLVNLFFATTELKKDPGVDGGAKPRAVEKIGVLGGGLMGAGVSYVSALNAGAQVRVKDRDAAGVAHGLAYVDKRLRERVRRKRMTPLAMQQTLSRVSAATDFTGLHDAPLVIEAVFEDLELKRAMLREVEAAGPDDVIFASNTSALPIAQIAAASSHPETVIAMHYFSPVAKMPLLEIVVTGQTADWVTATCVAFGRAQGKTVIVVNDGVGFYTSRILVPFVIEAATLVTEGVPIEAIDRALLDFGFPVGPITLLDEVGIDVAEKVAATAQAAFGERIQVPPALARLSSDQRLGRKNGRGFYRYGRKHKGKAERPVDDSVYAVLGVTQRRSMAAAEIAERCTMSMVNEAIHCLADGVLSSPRDGDIGAVFGLGFPPFRGGPFRYVDSESCSAVHTRLLALQERHGERFTPASMLADFAAAGRTFHL